ncbi:(Fe-S)-binding protein [Sulfobacillus harzensis]|uniref:Glycolate oxidase iron-sulfur subunit n=1 Tax=Sulfobacillus harzensis TaxID=2729629 RepID=A0A7Y0L6F3_9FIRM|nr:heterodisulfide reductase-related iron-sulfur binding cluster [Sulfobacillus harzensis]NMP23606.1 4Fe-4S dicluster domain-containing protein [Sulfobacillus harzensis]
MDNAVTRAIQEINHCNKCGFCLPACPTYQLTGNELDSPRGRIAMVEGMLHGEIEAQIGLEESLKYCLGCRACETACPSGVQYHLVLEAGRAKLDQTRPAHRGLTFVPRTLMRLTRHPKRLRRLAALGRRAGALPLPQKLKQLTPMLAYQSEPVKVDARNKPATTGAAFFAGCVQEALFGDANQAAEALLRAAGYDLVNPPQQTCCGAIAWHAGRAREARRLAQRNIQAYEITGEVPIANTAGGCGAMLSEYGELFRGDPVWEERAERFSARVRDWSELLLNAPEPLRFVGRQERVALQNSCHLVNVEKAGENPVALIRQVEGDEYVPLPSQDRCCGSAGIYNIQHPEWADRILEGKMAEMGAYEPDRLLVVNPGCAMQMTLGVERAGRSTVVEHLARYLYRAWLQAESLDQT